MTLYRAIGLMSGTSMDGVDIALVETDGESAVTFGATGFQPYSDADRALLRAALDEAAGLDARAAATGAVAAAEKMVTARHAEAVESFLAEKGLSARDIHLVGFHGQTVLHRPDQALTVQLGDGGLLAREEGGQARPGMLVSLRGVELHVDHIDDLPVALDVRASVLLNSESGWQYEFRIEHAGRKLASGRAAVMLQPIASPAEENP